eukprot:CAMPEP_0172539274 /NCGR_PEP_ID=MMETSP1067-20121228/10496_1 /TAXON_ID=265564 ORGANISM="Thalassiosira punctigera, Strain Tpunct2005C2" /NCGR_SAMPLE_ID=MMETSP1067 /ASSEMBLY_ACC=CAM_ASM_000444 /LENGTH=2104 /DNA_ID=CAMNT_0013324925 /DNA_START=492 /DNA_END=6806 /DNA_ORIENTATION=-
MEVGAHVWLRSPSSRWGWVPARIVDREESSSSGGGNFKGKNAGGMVKLTLRDDTGLNSGGSSRPCTPDVDQFDSFATPHKGQMTFANNRANELDYFADITPFESTLLVDSATLANADHPDIKLRNLPTSYQLTGGDPEANVVASPSTLNSPLVVGGVHDLIGLTHLHEPAILHALRLRYDADIIYTSTGPILIAINPFQRMDHLYSDDVMESYRRQGEGSSGSRLLGSSSSISTAVTPFKNGTRKGVSPNKDGKLPPHAYKTADDAYRAMKRGLENSMLMNTRESRNRRSSDVIAPADQSILVSGESGAGKTVTTKIVLNYFAMLSKQISKEEALMRESSQRSSPRKLGRLSSSGSRHSNFGGSRNSSMGRFGSDASVSSRLDTSTEEEDVCIEQQVLQSNPILEAFGNARTLRNDNSSRFGKYIDIRFTSSGRLSGAKIETYLLEKVRLIHPSAGERNYHVFYQFLEAASKEERKKLGLDRLGISDFRLLNGTGTSDRRDGVVDGEMHQEMLDAMVTIGFDNETIQSLLRLITAILYCGNITFTARHQSDANGMSDACFMDETHSAKTAARLLGVPMNDLAYALTYRAIRAGNEVVYSPLDKVQSEKACEALMKATYGATFDFIVGKVNGSISTQHQQRESLDGTVEGSASIGVLDIFGFETFEVNNFEQICINYTNEALQQQFNKYVFKLEQDEYEREGILWKFISFPDNQDVLDLIDRKHTGILALLDEQCIVPRSNDHKFTRYLYAKCDSHRRFGATSAQRVDYKFSIEHYAGPVEYSTDNWLEKNKDQLPASSANLIRGTKFDLLARIQKFIRTEDRDGRGSVATKSVGAQFSAQLAQLRSRIDVTVPHYIRCLKPNDELVPDSFDPKMIVDQLRCGGVLEAVRVSRAGYPTRYPHDVFKARYYILGETNNPKKMSPLDKWKRRSVAASLSEEESEVKRLVSKIAFDIWEADHKAMMAALEEDVTSIADRSSNSMQSSANYINGHMNLVAISTANTPPEQRKNRAQAKKRRETGSSYMTSGIARPETAQEFLSLDFSSRCAIAGLQLGRTKVFLRREAFDRIEALRAQKFGKSAVTVQRIVRGVQARMFCYLLKEEMTIAAVIIQRGYRDYVDRLYYIELNKILVPSAIKIQAIARGSNTRMWYFGTLYGCMRIQALVRGFQARAYVARLIDELHQPVASPVQSFDGQSSFDRGTSFEEEISEENIKQETSHQLVPVEKCQAVVEVTSEWVQLRNLVSDENWAAVESTLDQYPELAEEVDPTNGEMLLHMICRHPNVWTLLVDMVLVLYPKALLHKDSIGALPLHHAAAHDNVAALEIIYSAYKEGVSNVDSSGRQPIHVAAEFDAAESVKFLLAKSPEGAYTMVHRPSEESGGGLPLHIACRHHSSMSIVTSLLAENFSSAKRADENGDLPIHLLLRNGEVVEQVMVKTVLTCFASAISRTDKNGDLPLSVAIKSACNASVVNYLMVQYPEACKLKDGSGHSNLHLAFEHGADDRTMLGLLNHAPELSTNIDKETGMLPIQIATEHEHSHFIVHHLLKQDLPIDIKEKVKAKVQDHKFSWNHIVSNTDDMYYPVISKILQQCTQPQVLALAHVEGPDGRIALSTATSVCKHEMRVMLRLFNTLEVVNQRPAFSNPDSDTQIFYALRYDPPKHDNGQWSLVHEDNKKDGDYLDEWDDASHVSGLSRVSNRSNQSLSSRCSQVSIDEKMKQIKKEKGQQVIAKLTSRSDIVERELKIRKDYHLSRHYVPAVISVHHTVQHAAYSEAMAEPGYCITMEGADTTAENLMLDMRKYGKSFSTKILKRIGISLLHMHEHGLVHGDFGTHNVGKFGNRWKLLGVGGSKAIGSPTDPKRGFYHPPETVVVESKRAPLGKKEVVAKVVSIQAKPSHDIWAFGVVMYEAICGVPLSPYACRGKRAMTANEIAKIGKWDEPSLERALRHVDPNDINALGMLRQILHYNPNERCSTLREALEHPFFSGSSEDRVLKKRESSDGDSRSATRNSAATLQSSRHGKNSARDQARKNEVVKNGLAEGLAAGLKILDQENSDNGVPRTALQQQNGKVKGDHESTASGKSRGSIMSFSNKLKMKGLRERMRARGQI